MGAAVRFGEFFLNLESLEKGWYGCRDFCCLRCGWVGD